MYANDTDKKAATVFRLNLSRPLMSFGAVIFSHVPASHIDPYRVMDDAVSDRFRMGNGSKTVKPVFLATLGTEDH